MTAIRPGAAPGADPRLREAATQVETMLLKQLVRSSGAFKGGTSAGSAIREDQFAEALASAVAGAGGIGLADALTRSLGGAPPAPTAPAPAPGGPPQVAVTPRAAREALIRELPVTGRVTSGYGERVDPFTGAESRHDGVDVGAPQGTPIHASAAGVVRSAGPRGGYGNAVEIDHGNGVVTLYGHASELLVHPGETVSAGQEIARVGSTGRSTGPHLHFEVRVGGRPVDPSRVLKTYSMRVDDPGRSGP